MTGKTQNFLPVSDTDLSGNERSYLLQAFDSGRISGSGPFVDRLESAFSDFCGTTYSLACANGTVALHLALLALGVGPGDEVIVPSLTYIATANAVSYCGATPVFADADPDTWNAGAEQIEPLITSRTKAVIVVHLFGNPVDMDAVLALARAHDVFVVEDAAEAHGATIGDRKVGSIGDIGTFSFYGNKIMTTGEGGLVTTDNEELANRMRLRCGQGMDPARRYWFPIIGYNYRLTNLQCAIGLAQLERIGDFIRARRRCAETYRAHLSEIDALTFQAQPDGHGVWWMFSVLMPDPEARDRTMRLLEENGIETRPLFWPVHILPPYQSLGASCPVAERIAPRGINLPSGGHIGEDEIRRIAGLIRKALA
ncbi:MAG: aminotransferase class I/II-fold pyridoxal phosphate-dependent enzyme [Gammaproteobacteria bacterium]|nr:aminotransferase class I/II-fold pyridoxal phosphate-dependent enzyme [Gammaproteobacteria bacterium]